jgi:lysophospholipase L1-like esterase
LVLLAGGVLVGLACAEGALRVAGIGYMRQWDHDPVRGLVAVPNQQGWYCQEGCAYVRNNSLGFRDDEWAIDKPPGTVRIAVLGDSFVQAREVAKDERFTEVLEERVNAHGGLSGRPVEVLNFGVAGYGTADELLVWRHVAQRYAPDIVLLAFFSGNDIINNVKSLQRNSNRPYFVLRDGELELDASFRSDPGHVMTWRRRLAYAAIDRSRLLQLAYRAREQLRGRTVHEDRAEVAAAAGLEDVGINRMVFAEPTQPKWTEAWTVTDAILAQLHREVESAGARFMVVTLTMGPQVHPDPAARERLLTRLGAPDLFYPDDRLAEIGRAHGFPVVNLARPLQVLAERDGTFFHGFSNTKLGTGHWNAAGHRAAAELIADRIERLLDPARPAPEAEVPAAASNGSGTRAGR